MMKTLKKNMEKYDFFKKDFIENIEHVDIFCENCSKCPMMLDCPSVETMGKTGKILRELHKAFQESEVDSKLHELTSEEKGELDEVVRGAGCVLPVKTVMSDQGCVCSPIHNFLVFEMADGRKFLYDVDLEDGGDEEDDDGMMYG